MKQDLGTNWFPIFAFFCIKSPNFGNTLSTLKCQKEVFVVINKVEIANVNTSKLKVLTNAENKELFRQMKAGDSSAREKIIQGNLRLVLSVIQRFGGRRRKL